MTTKVITKEYTTIHKKTITTFQEGIKSVSSIGSDIRAKTFPTRMPVITAPKQVFKSYTPSALAILRATSLVREY